MAAAPVIVESPAGDSFDMPVFLRAAETVVTSTPFLDWRPAAPAADGSARVSLATFQMCVAFVPRCTVSRIPADLAAARAVNVLVFRLSDAAWARILSELRDSNAFRIDGRHQLDTVQLNWTVTYANGCNDPGGYSSGLSCSHV